jgi:hypothetical protein
MLAAQDADDNAIASLELVILRTSPLSALTPQLAPQISAVTARYCPTRSAEARTIVPVQLEMENAFPPLS